MDLPKLKKELARIKNLSFVETHHVGDTGIGKDLEDLLNIKNELLSLVEQLTQISKDIAHYTVYLQDLFLRRTIFFALLFTASLSTIAVNTFLHRIPEINISLYYIKLTIDTDTANIVIAVSTALTFFVMLADLIRKVIITKSELKEKIHKQAVIEKQITNIFLGSDDYVSRKQIN